MIIDHIYLKKQDKTTILSNCHDQNCSNEYEESSKLGSPSLAVRSIEFLIEEDTPQSRHQESTTAERIANSISQSTSRGSITEVTNSKQKGRPNSYTSNIHQTDSTRPSLLPSGMEVLRHCALRSLQRITHYNATN